MTTTLFTSQVAARTDLGLPDEKWGQRVTAVVQLRGQDGGEPGELLIEEMTPASS